MRDLLGLRVLEVSSLRPNLSVDVEGPVAGKAVRWREFLEVRDAAVLSRFSDGAAALTSKNNHSYLACWPGPDLLASLLRWACAAAKLEAADLPDHVRIRRRGDVTFAFNYGDAEWRCPLEARILLGDHVVRPYQCSAWRNPPAGATAP